MDDYIASPDERYPGLQDDPGRGPMGMYETGIADDPGRMTPMGVGEELPAPTQPIQAPAQGPLEQLPTSSGYMGITAGMPRPNLSPEQQAALQHRIAAATAITPPDRRAITGPGGGISMPDIGEMYRAAFTHLPVDQAMKAVDAGIQYQGNRVYQQALQAGKTPAEALTIAGPMLFHRSPTAMVKAMTPPTPPPTGPIQAVDIMGPNGQPTGQQAFRHGTSGVTIIKPPPGVKSPTWVPPNEATGAPGHFETPSGSVHIPARERAPAGGLGQRDVLATLRSEEKELAKDPMVKFQIDKKATPRYRAEAEAKKQKLADIQKRMDDMISGLSSTVPQNSGAKKALSAADKVQKARQLRQEHPDWTKAEILKAVEQ